MSDADTPPDGRPAKRYIAFLSYAHADRGVARWLHQGLERYRTPKRLVQEHGASRRLFPIFRDREELPAGGHLPERLTAALEASDYLVVLCSPRAAVSEWVSQEVATYKAMGRGDRIIPVIAEGEPADAFPPALRFEVDASGAVSDRSDPAERLGADLRRHADGKREGLLKIVAGLLGVGFSEVKRREVEAARRRAGFAYGLVGLFALLAISACGTTYVALDRNERLQAALVSVLDTVAGRIDDALDKQAAGQLTTAETADQIDFAKGMIDTAFALAPDATRLLEEQGRLKLLVANHYLTIGRTREAEAEAADAEAIYATLEERNADGARRQRSLALDVRADALERQGELEPALALHEEGLAIARDLAASAPDDIQYQRDVLVSLDNIAGVRLSQGDIPAAHAHFADRISATRDLLERAPDDDRLRLDLASSLSAYADISLRYGETEAAFAAFDESLAITRDVAANNPDNIDHQSRLAGILERVAQSKARQGDSETALALFEEALAVWRSLATYDPGDLDLVRGQTSVLDHIGGIRAQRGDITGAAEAFEQTVAIRRDLLARDPDNLNRRRDVWVSLNTVASMRSAQGESEEALVAYEEGLALARDLAAQSGDHVDYRRDVALSLGFVALVHQSTNQPEKAREAFEKSLAIRRELAEQDPSDLVRHAEVATALLGVADSYIAENDTASALPYLAEARDTRRRLVAINPGDVEYISGLADVLDRLGVAHTQSGEMNAAINAYREALAIREALTLQDPAGRLNAQQYWLTARSLASADGLPWSHVVAIIEEAQARGLYDAETDAVFLDEARARAANALLADAPDADTAYQAGAFSEAFEAGSARLELVEDALGDGWVTAEAAAEEYGTHAWDAILAGEPAAAERSARRAVELAPDLSWVRINLAHALMFQDQTAEADALYDEGRGGLLPEFDHAPWEEILADDFASFREAGRDHPHMDIVLARMEGKLTAQ